MLIGTRIQEVKNHRKCTGSLGEYRTGRIKVTGRILLYYFLLCTTLTMMTLTDYDYDSDYDYDYDYG